jgi:multiple sugar transport system substrate-binding protein
MRWAAALLLAAALACRAEPPKPIVRFLTAADNGGGWTEIVERFQKEHPEIVVERKEGQASTNAREEAYARDFMAGGGTYDVVLMDIIWVPRFAAQGWLRPLDDLFAPAARESFLPGDLRGSTFEGRIYRVPMYTDAGMLYYRTDLIDKPPETFDELVELAKKNQKPPDLWGFVFQGRQYEGLVCAFLEVLWGFGGDVLDDDGKVALDRPAATQALAWMKSLVGTVAPEGVTTYQEEESRHLFHEGRALFMRNWPYAWILAQKEESKIRGRIGIVPMVHAPGQKSAATLGGWGFGISKTTRHPEAAWSFVEFATRPEQQKILHLKNGNIPTRRSLFSDPDILKASPHYAQLLPVLMAARPRPVHASYARISDVLQAAVSAALTGKTEPEAALKEASEKIREIVGKRD